MPKFDFNFLLPTVFREAMEAKPAILVVHKGVIKHTVDVSNATTNTDVVKMAALRLRWKTYSKPENVKKCSIHWHSTEKSCLPFHEMEPHMKINRFPGKLGAES